MDGEFVNLPVGEAVAGFGYGAAFVAVIGGAFEGEEVCAALEEGRGFEHEPGHGADGARDDEGASAGEVGGGVLRFACAEGAGGGAGATGEFDGVGQEGGFFLSAVEEYPVAVRQPEDEGQAGIAAAAAEVEADVSGAGEFCDVAQWGEAVEDMELEVFVGRGDAGEVDVCVDVQEVAVEGFEKRAFFLADGDLHFLAGLGEPGPGAVGEGEGGVCVRRCFQW